MTIKAFHDVVEAALVNVAPSYLGRRYIAEHATPPRYVWVPAARRYIPPRRTQGVTRASTEALQLIQVHIWGKDHDQAELLESALITALRLPEVCNGANYELQAGDWVDPSLVTAGEVLVVPLVLPVKVPRVHLPTVAPADPLNPICDAVTSDEVTVALVDELVSFAPVGGA